MGPEPPWEHPDWYDLHDVAWTAGSEREPEHYRELILVLPPLDATDHLVDVGAGTGKVAALVAGAYPHIGAVTLIEPNARKLDRAVGRVRAALAKAEITPVQAGIGVDDPLPRRVGTIVTIGSVLMPTLELRGGTLAAGLAWLRAGLGDVASLIAPGGWVYAAETLAAPWARGGLDDPVRRLTQLELLAEFERLGFHHLECTYRFRDRIVIRAQAPVVPSAP
jgi:SAM-dependent methyltransferase